ncbi:general stress protein [Paracoccus suum]|uniref:General stress protein n=1 Tax=Paracoccus suum TaxID=2259340 RepID=A0A344PPC3_9RHOB|nr:pyridoxamine 5'-phosphate oxidase family protein [Paracoccus suum]AXC51228.1 general stress protein [Paracoccus suum]
MAEKRDNEDRQELPPAEQRAQFWKRLEGINAGMLGATSDLKLVPMSHTADPDQHALWFITAAGTHLVEQTEGGAQDALYVVAEGSGKLYARIEGKLERSGDQAKLDEIWNTVAASWFEDGKQDPDVRLLKLAISRAEVWTTTGGLGFLYELAKNKLTGAEPDMGEHFFVE